MLNFFSFTAGSGLEQNQSQDRAGNCQRKRTSSSQPCSEEQCDCAAIIHFLGTCKVLLQYLLLSCGKKKQQKNTANILWATGGRISVDLSPWVAQRMNYFLSFWAGVMFLCQAWLQKWEKKGINCSSLSGFKFSLPLIFFSWGCLYWNHNLSLELSSLVIFCNLHLVKLP